MRPLHFSLPPLTGFITRFRPVFVSAAFLDFQGFAALLHFILTDLHFFERYPLRKYFFPAMTEPFPPAAFWQRF